MTLGAGVLHLSGQHLVHRHDTTLLRFRESVVSAQPLIYITQKLRQWSKQIATEHLKMLLMDQKARGI
jgi:hypothetical protein